MFCINLKSQPQKIPDGFTLMELIVFMAIVGIGLGALAKAFMDQAQKSIDPMAHLKAVECAQAQMEAVMARAYDGNKVSGGLKACGSHGWRDDQGEVIDCDAAPDTLLDDLMDYTLPSWKPDSKFFSGCNITVSVKNQGADFTYLSGLHTKSKDEKKKPLDSPQARLITVTATVGSESYALKAYRINF